MKVKPSTFTRLKIKLKIKLIIDGKEYDGEAIINQIDEAKDALICDIYNKQFNQASDKTTAVQWTAELLNVDERTVWRAIKNIEFPIPS